MAKSIDLVLITTNFINLVELKLKMSNSSEPLLIYFKDDKFLPRVILFNSSKIFFPILRLIKPFVQAKVGFV